jgi:hypothetical protein
MTPPAASTTAGRSSAPRRRPGSAPRRGSVSGPRGARRFSGPAGGMSTMRVPAGAGGVSLPGGGALAGVTPFGLRVARRCAEVQDARFLDRLIRGRLWIALVAVMLIGLVFLQLSLLSLNSGIGRAIERSAVLDRQNSSLRMDISRLDAGQRVQDIAAADGMVMPSVGDVTYLKAGAARPDVAARGITAPASTADQAAVTPDPAAGVPTPTGTPPAGAAAVPQG